MHILTSLLLIVGALTVLVLGLVGVVPDLLERGPYEAPLIKNDRLAWPPRYQSAGRSSEPEELPASRRFAAAWSCDGDRHPG